MRKGAHVFSWFCYMRKKKKKVWRRRNRRISTAPNRVAQRKCRRQILVGSGGVERQAQICTSSFLTTLTLITSGRNRITSKQDLVSPWMSQSTSSISPNLSGKASSNMLQLLNRIYVYICLLCQGKDAIKRVSYARDVLNDGARYCCKLSYSIYQAFWCWRLELGNVIFTKMVNHWSLCKKCFTYHLALFFNAR